ncbi:hypothetical protein J7F03_30495 [Streptomyces sp. ISL-43]|uniref:hypothetical protein n=1 Tax=Streptomyces sp. ISL-43 TaxID=2819183 RepID=UPI001BE8A8FF|nr:hypothetical protein [Streptomyces sp. ISL-43]MBT2451324.1 hypothetical protein [Streptomyces sp. ISL-43]
MRRSGRWLTAGATATALALIPGTAFAEKDPGGGGTRGGNTSGSINGNTITSKVRFDPQLPAGKTQSGDFHATSNWTPPACWYEPMSAAEFKAVSEASYTSVVNDPAQPSYAKSSMAELKKIYTETKYKDYNLDQADKGAFWVGVQNPNRKDDLASFSCSDLPEWVPNGTPPPVRNAITPEVLAQAAYNQLDIPTTTVTLAPKPENIKVNLATWVYHDRAEFKPVKVTASLSAGGTNISATTTARPVSLHIKAGTSDAQLHPGSGDCAINTDGTIGAAYSADSDGKAPPCGLTYLRSSGNGSYTLEASITWEVSWTGSNGQDGNLPSGTFSTTQNVIVQEIQAVNR